MLTRPLSKSACIAALQIPKIADHEVLTMHGHTNFAESKSQKGLPVSLLDLSHLTLSILYA